MALTHVNRLLRYHINIIPEKIEPNAIIRVRRTDEMWRAKYHEHKNTSRFCINSQNVYSFGSLKYQTEWISSHLVNKAAEYISNIQKWNLNTLKLSRWERKRSYRISQTRNQEQNSLRWKLKRLSTVLYCGDHAQRKNGMDFHNICCVFRQKYHQI